MSQTADMGAGTVSSDELQAVLRELLCSHFNRQLSIARLERQTSLYSSSFVLEELDIKLEDGRVLQLMFKDSSNHALLPTARNIKPAFVYDPRREINVYQKILPVRRTGTATCFGAVVDPQLDRYWLFLERVPGVELYQVGELEKWQQAARWLAGLHTGLAAQGDLLSATCHLLTYDGDYFRQWPRRAAAFLKAEQSQRRLEWLTKRYERVIEFLTGLPRTFVHGEFYASNVLVQETEAGLRICPVDWEMAGLGPGLIDLAALTAGEWAEEERLAFVRAYHAELASRQPEPMSWETFLGALDWCRLHLAVQWLGWSPAWSPPEAHAQDWLREALIVAEKIGL
jgi:thiamine kinase-like enzyme